MQMLNFVKIQFLIVDKISKEIDANNKKLTPEYLRYIAITSLSNNTKFFFGESIPKYLSSNMLNDNTNKK